MIRSLLRHAGVDGAVFAAIFSLAVPMVVSNLSVPLLGLVDTAIIGHLSEASYLAGVALGSMIFTTIVWLLGFLRMATTGIVAQLYGEGDGPGLSAALYRSVLLALLLGMLALALQGPLYRLVVGLAQPSDAVAGHLGDYLGIRLLSLPAALCNLVLIGWLLGVQDARSPMWLLLIANSLNIVLDVVLVVWLEQGVQGAALASVIADYSALFAGLIFARLRLRKQSVNRHPVLGDIFDPAQSIRLLRLNADIFVRSLCLQLCFSFLTIQGARLGDDIVAANAVLLNFLMFIAYGLDGVAYAVEALVGKHVGRGDRQALRATVNAALLMAGVMGLGASLLFWLAGLGVIDLLTDIVAVRAAAALYLPWLVLLPLTAVWCFVMDGVFIGTTRAAEMRNSMLFSTFAVFFPVYLASASLGNHALWLAMNAFMVARGVSLLWMYSARMVKI